MDRLVGKNILIIIPKDYYMESEFDPVFEAETLLLMSFERALSTNRHEYRCLHFAVRRLIRSTASVSF